MAQTGEPPVETTVSGVPSARVEQPGVPSPPGQTPPTAAPPATVPVDVDALRHPTENSRFALALVAAAGIVSIALFVLLSLGRVAEIAGVVLAIIAAFAALWFSLQLWRVRMLADGVQVTPESLPQVQEVIDIVRARLNYDRRVDVFVVDKVSRVLKADSAPITLTSFFGVRVIVAEGGALGDLTNEREREQLIFLLATFVGALKAQHTRWSPYLMALELSGLPKLVFLFVYPWYRATTYTGDRIAYACCGDLDVSLEAVYRALVGKDTAPHLRHAGLVQQCLVVRRKVILRLSQLLRRVPHASNRYLALLAFASTYEAAVFDKFRAELGDGARDADDVFADLRRRRPSRVAVPIGVLLAALMLVVGVVAGLKLPDNGLARGIDSATTDESGFGAIETGPVTVETGPVTEETTSPATEEPSPAVSLQTSAQAVLAHLPADLRDTCREATPLTDQGEYAAFDCNAAGSFGPITVTYVAYLSTAAMQAAFDSSHGGFPKAPCSSGFGRTTWHRAGSEGGPIACYTIAAGESAVFWGDNETAIIGYAHDPVLTVDEVHSWWKDHPILGN
jgi:hypothetical protein